MPWLIALRVVSLPATTSRMKNDPNSCGVSRSPSTSACIIMLVDVVAGVGPAVLAERLRVHEHLHQHAHQLLERAAVLGVADAEDDVGPLKICCSSSSGMPIISQMICRGSGAAISLDEVALAVGELLEQPVDDAPSPWCARSPRPG